MKKIISILFILLYFVSNAQNDGTLREIDWKTYVKNVVYINDSTYIFDAEPIDLNDLGAIERKIGNYFVDFVGNRYKIINSTAITITVLDEYRKFIAPQSDQLGRVYKSVGDGLMQYVGGVDLTVIDDLSRWKVQAADNEYWWRLINSLMPVSYCPTTMTVNSGTLNTGTVSDLCEVGGTDVNISELSGADPLRVTFTFNNVERLNSFVFYGDYNGGAGHVVLVEAYNTVTMAWDFIGEFGTSAVKQWYGFTIYQPNNYVNAGTVSVRIRHQDNGIQSHSLILDYVDINAGGGGGSAFVTASSIYFVPYNQITGDNVQTGIQQLYDLWVAKDTSFVNELDSFYSDYQQKWLFSGDTIYGGGGVTPVDSANNIYEDVLATGEVVIDIGFTLNPNSIVFINGDAINPGRWSYGGGNILNLDLPIFQYDELVVLQNGISNNYLTENILTGSENLINVGFLLSSYSTVFFNGDLLMTTEWSGVGSSFLTLNFPIAENDILVVKN